MVAHSRRIIVAVEGKISQYDYCLLCKVKVIISLGKWNANWRNCLRLSCEWGLWGRLFRTRTETRSFAGDNIKVYCAITTIPTWWTNIEQTIESTGVAKLIRNLQTSLKCLHMYAKLCILCSFIEKVYRNLERAEHVQEFVLYLLPLTTIGQQNLTNKDN